MLISYYAIIYEENEGYYLIFPDLPGCVSCGDDIYEVKQMGQDAMELYLDGVEVEKLPVKTEFECGNTTINRYILISAELKIDNGRLFSDKVQKRN